MTGLETSATQRRIQNLLSGPERLAESVELLKRANRYVGVHSSIGGQALGVQITEFIAAYERDKKAQEKLP